MVLAGWSVSRILSCLPKGWREALIRRKAVYPSALLDDLRITRAASVDAYSGAFHLVHEAYVARGWIRPQPGRQWVGRHQALPESTVLVLYRSGDPVGTVGIVEDSPLGLPIERTFPEVGRLRGPGRKVAELGTLALASHARSTGLGILLMIAAWRYARRYLQVTDVVIAVDAHVASYYESLFRFSTYTGVRTYSGFPRHQHARTHDPVVALHQDVVTMDPWIEAHWSRPRNGTLHPASIAVAPFPASFEDYPALPEGRASAARAKLPRAVFQQLLRNTQLPEPMDAEVTNYLRQWRSRETLAEIE